MMVDLPSNCQENVTIQYNQANPENVNPDKEMFLQDMFSGAATEAAGGGAEGDWEGAGGGGGGGQGAGGGAPGQGQGV